jgi:hypothetical protein
MRSVWVPLLLLAGATPAAAQTPMVRPVPVPLDSNRAAVRDALVLLRDSLGMIDAAAARLQRDYREASPTALLVRARLIRDACAHSAGMVPTTRTSVLAAKISQPERIKHREELVAALDQLKKSLTVCQSEFAKMSQAGQAETVRGYGNPRATRVQASLRQYERTLNEFLGVMGIRVVPPGAENHPASG